MLKQTDRILVKITPAQLEEYAGRLSVVSNWNYVNFWGDIFRAIRELVDLRAKVKALEPYIQHKDECAIVPAVLGDGGVVVHGPTM